MNETFFDLEFDIDGDYQDDIYNDQPWLQESTIIIPEGSHTLTWTAYGGDYANDAAFVDRVSFTPTVPTNVLQSARFEFVLFNDRSILTPGGGYLANLYLSSIQPDPVTFDEVESPNGLFTCFYTNHLQGSWFCNEQVLGTWAELADEFTNGLWTLYVNKGDPSEKQFKFPVTLDGMDTALLSPVTILTPADGSVNVPTNSSIEWTLRDLTLIFLYSCISNRRTISASW